MPASVCMTVLYPRAVFDKLHQEYKGGTAMLEFETFSEMHSNSFQSFHVAFANKRPKGDAADVQLPNFSLVESPFASAEFVAITVILPLIVLANPDPEKINLMLKLYSNSMITLNCPTDALIQDFGPRLMLGSVLLSDIEHASWTPHTNRVEKTRPPYRPSGGSDIDIDRATATATAAIATKSSVSRFTASVDTR